MAEEENVTELDVIGDKPGWITRVKTFVGLKTEVTKPNIQVKVLYSDERDIYLDELALDKDEQLVSHMYQVIEEKKEESTEIIVPLNMPKTSIPPEKLFIFTFCMKLGDKWTRIEAEYKEHQNGGFVHGQRTKMDVFCVIAKLKEECCTIGAEGDNFVSTKDDRISMDVPKHAIKEEAQFKFIPAAVDQDRLQLYQKHKEAYSCITGFTNTIRVSSSSSLQKEASLTLPLDADVGDADSRIVYIQWNKTGDNEEFTVHDVEPKQKKDKTYTFPINKYGELGIVAVKRNATDEDIRKFADIARGRLNLCVLLAFIDSHSDPNVNFLLVDCVEVTKVKSVVEKHTKEGYQEVTHSRSGENELEDKAKIKISLESGIKPHDKANTTNAFTFNKMIDTNMKVVHFTGDAGYLRFSWNKTFYLVYVNAGSKVGKTKAKGTAPRGKTQTNIKTNKQADSKPLELRRQKSVYADVHPILSDKSLASLADSLPPSDWRRVGLELDFTTDQIDRIFEKFDKMKAFELLKEWREKHREKGQEDLIEDLIKAFRELKRNDFVEVLRDAHRSRRRICVADFDIPLSDSISSSGTPFAPDCASMSSIETNTDSMGADTVFESNYESDSQSAGRIYNG